MIFVALICAFLAFALSASAGLGGSLLLVPALILILGTKQGIALAALLLAANNVFKVIVYRKTVPLRAAVLVIAMTILGSAIGADMLLAIPESYIDAAFIFGIALSLTAERRSWQHLQLLSAPVLALMSGTFSGFSGTSGPLKGVALRCLRLERAYLVGAASVVSLAGDATKSLVFWRGDLLSDDVGLVIVAAIPLMPVATMLGRHINQSIGERAYAALFWGVMLGYTARVLLA